MCARHTPPTLSPARATSQLSHTRHSHSSELSTPRGPGMRISTPGGPAQRPLSYSLAIHVLRALAHAPRSSRTPTRSRCTPTGHSGHCGVWQPPPPTPIAHTPHTGRRPAGRHTGRRPAGRAARDSHGHETPRNATKRHAPKLCGRLKSLHRLRVLPPRSNASRWSTSGRHVALFHSRSATTWGRAAVVPASNPSRVSPLVSLSSPLLSSLSPLSPLLFLLTPPSPPRRRPSRCHSP